MREQLTEHYALRTIEDDGVNATDLLRKHCPGLLTRYRRNISSLHKTMTEIEKAFPDAKLYVASGTLCLMLGDSHDTERDANPQKQLVVDADNRLDIDGGDW